MKHSLKYWLFEPTQNTLAQALRAVVLGGICTVFDMGLMFLLNQKLSWQPWLCTVCGYLLGTVINYTLGIVWIFKLNPSKYSRQFEFILFCCISAIGMGLNAGGMALLTNNETESFAMLAIRMAVIVVVFAWTFGARKWWLYRKQPGK